MRLLVANANTTQAVTDTVVAEARQHAAPGTEIIGATASFGAGVVSTEATNAIAGHAALDLLARHAGQVDAAVLAISFDTALAAAQELMPVPVVGMTEAALHTACLMGPRFGFITFGAGSRAMYLDLVARAGLAPRMTGCETITLATVAEYGNTGTLDAEVQAAVARLAEAGACSVVIAGAATAGMSRRLQRAAPVQLLDGIGCAVRQAELLAAMGARPARAKPLVQDKPPQGLSAPLAALLAGSQAR